MKIEEEIRKAWNNHQSEEQPEAIPADAEEWEVFITEDPDSPERAFRAGYLASAAAIASLWARIDELERDSVNARAHYDYFMDKSKAEIMALAKDVGAKE